MNIENIQLVAGTLSALGFPETIGRELAWYACFGPSEFCFTHAFHMDRGKLSCKLFFERQTEGYVCRYYEASLLITPEMRDGANLSAEVSALDEEMSTIDWSKKRLMRDVGNSENYELEMAVEKIIAALTLLARTEEGKTLAHWLQLKYWSDAIGHPLAAELARLRVKYELSLRFYLLGHEGISVQEAYRFLLNRWTEKQLYIKRKEGAGGSVQLAGKQAVDKGRPKPSKKAKAPSSVVKV